MIESNVRVKRILAVQLASDDRGELIVELEMTDATVERLTIDMEGLGAVISDFLRIGQREARQRLPVTMRLGDGTRPVVELTAEEIDVRASFRTVDLVVRSGLVDVRLRLPTDKAKVVARQMHQEAQTPRARGE